MQFICELPDHEAYLCEDDVINYSHPLMQQTIKQLCATEITEIELVKHTFEFVRDAIPHACDISSSQVTCTASEVLYHQTGICYAKSHLLAALLRAQGIPAGFCYQRLLLGDTPETGYVIHGLNAVYLQTAGRWVRLDARGNKPGVQAEFSLAEEKLAFPVRAEFDEIDYPIIYARSHPKIVHVLQSHTDCLKMCQCALPDAL